MVSAAFSDSLFLSADPLGLLFSWGGELREDPEFLAIEVSLKFAKYSIYKSKQ